MFIFSNNKYFNILLGRLRVACPLALGSISPCSKQQLCYKHCTHISVPWSKCTTVYKPQENKQRKHAWL